MKNSVPQVKGLRGMRSIKQMMPNCMFPTKTCKRIWVRTKLLDKFLVVSVRNFNRGVWAYTRL